MVSRRAPAAALLLAGVALLQFLALPRYTNDECSSADTSELHKAMQVAQRDIEACNTRMASLKQESGEACASAVQRAIKTAAAPDCADAKRELLGKNEELTETIKSLKNDAMAQPQRRLLPQPQAHGSSDGGVVGGDLSDRLANRDHMNMKIYVYDMPKYSIDFYTAHKDEYSGVCANQRGESYIHKLFANSSLRTTNGAEADLFFVPVYAGCYRSIMGTELRKDAHRVTMTFMADALTELRTKYPYWSQSQGVDHIWVFVYDYGACLEYARNLAKLRSKPSGLENSIFLGYIGDLTPGMHCFSPHKDVTIPPYVASPAVIAGRGGATVDPATRKTLIHFRGIVKWEMSKWHTKEMHYSNGVREKINATFNGDPLFDINQGSTKDYVEEIKSSVFCLAPLGYSLWTFRLYESILLGCIPVIISDYVELPFEEYIDYSKFSIKVLESNVAEIKNRLLAVSKEEIAAKQKELARVWKYFVYHDVPEPNDAFDMILRRLHSKVRVRKPVALMEWT